MKIAFFGSSLVSAYWNGAATYYRGILSALAAHGHQITFYGPDAFGRQQHRDIDDPDWARVVVYPGDSQTALIRCLVEACAADVIVKASGVGVFDEYLEREVPRLPGGALRIFWDVDAPATLDRMQANEKDPFFESIGRYDMVFTYGGGEPVRSTYVRVGARECIPIYNALDPSTHHPVEKNRKFESTLGFLGNRLPDREARVDEFFFRAAAERPSETFMLGGNGWGDKPMPANVNYIGHVYTAEHNAFNVTPRMVLNISRDSMASYGFSPATRVFEAAGAGACLITDAWKGIELFLTPETEVLVAQDGGDVARIVGEIDSERARAIGLAARRRILSEHTYEHRAREVDSVLDALGKSTWKVVA